MYLCYIYNMYKALGPSHSSRATLAKSHHTIANPAPTKLTEAFARPSSSGTESPACLGGMLSRSLLVK